MSRKTRNKKSRGKAGRSQDAVKITPAKFRPRLQYLDLYDEIRKMHWVVKDVMSTPGFAHLDARVVNGFDALHAVLYMVEGELSRAECGQ